MRVLNLSLDSGVADTMSPVARRIAALSAAVGEVVVLAPKKGNKSREFLRIWGEAKRLLSEKHFDLITVQDTAYLALLAYLLARKFAIPFEVQVHGVEKSSGLRKLIARFVLRRADKIRVVSERLKRELVQRFTLNAQCFYVLPVYTQKSYQQIPSQPPLYKGGEKGGDFVFLTVGRLVPVKNTTLQIRAFARVAKEFPHTRLVVVGEGAERENLKRKAQSEKLKDKIRFEGGQENLERYYQDADAFLLTSNSEGWGVVVTEAAAFRLPIIMTDVGLAGEFIKNGENGLVIPIGDEEALVAAMKTMITDARLRTRLAEAARRSFLSLPTPQAAIQKQVEAWRSFK